MYKYIFIFFPVAATLLLVLLGVSGFYIDGQSNVTPFFVAISIFYWGVYAPRLMPSWIVFLLGLFQDALYGSTLGVSSLMLLILLLIVRFKRYSILRKSFLSVWSVFAIAMLFFSSVYYLLNSLSSLSLGYIDAAVIQMFLTICLYPLMHKIFAMIPIKSRILRS